MSRRTLVTGGRHLGDGRLRAMGTLPATRKPCETAARLVHFPGQTPGVYNFWDHGRGGCGHRCQETSRIPLTPHTTVSPAEAAQALVYSDAAFLHSYISGFRAKKSPSDLALSGDSAPNPWGEMKEGQVEQGSWQTHTRPGARDMNRERCSHHTVPRGTFWKILFQEGL